MTRRFVPILYMSLAFLLFSWPVYAQEKSSWDEQFQGQIREWMDTIIARDPQFKQWKQATTEVQTLGANQHQWLVSIKKSGAQVGYLVVGEAQDPKQTATFVLLEYGVGEYILFDDAFAPREVAAEPVYDGFASHWLIAQKSQMVNAKTGEPYPSAFSASEPVMRSLFSDELVHEGEHLTQARILKNTEQDPFDQIGWVRQLDSSEEVTWPQLWREPSDSRITLTVPLHHAQVLAPFVVGSFHVWNDENVYVGVWDEGLRFVPYTYAHKVGRFHVNETSSPAE